MVQTWSTATDLLQASDLVNHSKLMVTLGARLPLLGPPFVLYIGKTWPSYGPNMVHLKSDIMKITYFIQNQHLAMFKTSILPQVQTK